MKKRRGMAKKRGKSLPQKNGDPRKPSIFFWNHLLLIGLSDSGVISEVRGNIIVLREETLRRHEDAFRKSRVTLLRRVALISEEVILLCGASAVLQNKL